MSKQFDRYMSECESSGCFVGQRLEEESIKLARLKLPDLSDTDLKTLFKIILRGNEYFDGEPTSAKSVAQMMETHYLAFGMNDRA